ncbi:reticulon-3 [Elgaria multicarinata webbii]|uniref:reticulon-3 n=1 Tax=Elgaria multicarinata webbii TaxID=159646 RepID=UPI002FCD5409
MAEPATQSPYISSSAGGGSSEPGGRDLKGAGHPQSCADSFVSSSQPVSLFSTSQAGGQDAYLTHSGNQRETNGKATLSNAGKGFPKGQTQNRGTSQGLKMEAASVGSSVLEKSSFSIGSRVHSYGPAVQASFPGHIDSQEDVSVDCKAELSGSDQLKGPATGGEPKFASLTHPKNEAEQPPARVAASRPSTSPVVAGESVAEKDSPESPFEVIADKLEFDKEFRDVLGSNGGDISSNWVLHGERELLTDIPEDSVCEFRVKPRGGSRVPPGQGLSRQSSGTTAALEEVSKCVREMHSFTSELLNWDLIPKDLDGSPDADDGSPDADDGSGLSTSPAKDTDRVAVGPAVGRVELGKASAPHQPLTISLHQKGKPSSEAEERRAAAGRDVAVAKTADAAELEADNRWPNPILPEITDADSSGESDDTVIEDAPADPTFQSEKAAESSRAAPAGPIQTEFEHLAHEVASGQPHKLFQGGRIPPGTLECNWASVDDFESIQAKADALGGSPLGAPQPPKWSDSYPPAQAGPALGACGRGMLEEWPEAEGLFVSSPSPPLGGVKEAACPGTLDGESFMDFMKECLKSKPSESPEDAVETFSEAELKAARSEVAAPPPPKSAQDFEQEHLTIKALKEVGWKTEQERQSPTTPGKASPPGKSAEMPPMSALEKRPLCLEQAVDVKLAPAPAALHGAPHKSPPALPPVPHALTKLLAKFSVHDLIFWRDVKKTGVVFSTTLILLLSLAAFSVISVVSYLILALLSVTISFRVYKSVIQAVQKSEDGHPFKTYLDVDVALSSEAFHKYVSAAMVHVNRALKLIMRLFLVEDLVDSLKLAVVMWLMTYVGAIFNGITLLILGELLVFSVPVVYEKYKTQIDHYVGIARDQTKSIITKVQAKLPGVVKKKPE